MKNYIIAFIFILSIVSMVYQVSAYETLITVKTAPLAYVMVRVFEEGSRTNLIQSFPDQQVDFDGQIEVNSASNVSSLDIEVYIKLQRNGAAAYYKKYEGIEAGKPFTVTLPEENNTQSSNAVNQEENTTLSVTETGNLTSNVTISENSTAESVTGNVVIEADGRPINNLVIIIAVIVVILLILFGAIIRKKMKQRGLPREPKHSDTTTATKPDSFIPKDDQRLVEDLRATQSRLDQANKELNQLKGRLKNEEKIREIENRINAEKDELRRLRQGQ